MSGLYYLAYLVQTKNDLNRKRRRFYVLKQRKCSWAYNNSRKKPHKSFPFWYAEKMYTQSQDEMKAMTPEMRRVRVEIRAKFVWGSGGEIQYIKLDNKCYYPNDIRRLADCYLADEVLLGNK
jgi:hypothetical protein